MIHLLEYNNDHNAIYDQNNLVHSGRFHGLFFNPYNYLTFKHYTCFGLFNALNQVHLQYKKSLKRILNA